MLVTRDSRRSAANTSVSHPLDPHRKDLDVDADAIYATNANRKFCTKSQIYTSFMRKGKNAADENQRKMLRSMLSREGATRLEGSFGTQKQHYSLDKIKTRKEETEILWIFFGIHVANVAYTWLKKSRKRKSGLQLEKKRTPEDVLSLSEPKKISR